MVNPWDAHFNGAVAARHLAIQCRADAANEADATYRAKLLSEAERHDERAEWYEDWCIRHMPATEMEYAA